MSELDMISTVPPDVHAAVPTGISADCIGLQWGYPFPESIPVDELAQAADELIASEGHLPFQYHGSPTLSALAERLQDMSLSRGIHVAQEELQVTSGSSQGLDLAARVLLHDGGIVAVENPTYMEALQIFGNCRGVTVAYPTDEDGLNVDALDRDLSERKASGLAYPKLVYTVATFQNPTGITLSLERRQQLLELANKFDFYVLEDDAYGHFAGPEVPPPLKALDRYDRVLYAGSLSKIIAPGVRVGWLAAPASLLAKIRLCKRDLDQAFAWAVTSRYLAGCDMAARIEELRRQYDARRALTLAALSQYMPSCVSWTKPGGGFFIWVKIPNVDTDAMLPAAIAAGVVYAPGRFFEANASGPSDSLRLAFSYPEEEQIKVGVSRLAAVIRPRLRS